MINLCFDKPVLTQAKYNLASIILLLVTFCLLEISDLHAQRFDRKNFPAGRESFIGNRQTSDSSGSDRREMIREKLKKLREKRAGNVKPNAPVIVNDIAYARHHQRNVLDLYAPENASNLPVMVYIHGGAWRNGDKSGVGGKPDFFTSNGWIFISINYRLLPEGQHPNNVHDVASALAWIHDNINSYGGNKEQIFVVGFSAGAHLAALVAVAPEFLNRFAKDLSVIKGVILLDNPVSDVLDEVKGEAAQRLIDSFGTDPEVQKNGSPAHQVASGESIAPFLMFHSSGIPFGSYASKDFCKQARILCDALKAVGASCSVVDVTELNHGNLNNLFATPGDNVVTTKSMQFLKPLLD